jgi:predicted Zn finger-like uncharacterized protein
MFTVCPKCTLTLAVTANDLRIGQGYVRCGRCSNVFNALLKLTETAGDAATPTPPQADPASSSQIRQALSSAALSATAPHSPTTSAPQTPAPPQGRPQTHSPQPSSAPVPPAPPPNAPTPPRQTAAATTAVRAASPSTAVAGPAFGPGPGPDPARPATLARRVGDVPPAPASIGGTPLEAARHGSDADAIGQFEQVLQTLGISLLEDAPDAPAQPGTATPTPTPTPSAPTHGPDSRDYHSVETIVLEGDAVTHRGQDAVDEPIDELDALTRRLSAAAGEIHDAGQPARPQPARADSAAKLSAFNRRGGEDEFEFEFDDATAVGGSRIDRPPALVRAHQSGDASADSLLEDEAAEELADLDIPGLRATSTRRWPWAIGGAVLVALLAAQALNHWRDALAASPTWGGAVKQLYAAAGRPLRPHWDLGAYDVRQEGAASDADQQQIIHVRLSLANRARRAQPTPLLRLTLLDRYGKRIAQRDLAPADYWPKGRAPESFMASDERIDSEVAIRDPSAASASFELDVCLRDSGGAIRCAADASTPTVAAGVP